MRWRPALGAAALALTTCCTVGRAAPGGYVAMMAALRSAEATGRVRVTRIGFSVLKRPIPMVVIGPDDAPARVLILCRQHGDEPVSTAAALRVVRRAAAGDPALGASLRGVQLLIVPMVNPDGAQRFTRVNANGVDINRDWLLHSQPETRAVVAVYRRLRPQVVLDEHEWTVSDRCGSDSLETGLSTEGHAHVIQAAALAAVNGCGVVLRPERFTSESDPRLAHRFFGRSGAAAFLLETTPGVPGPLRLQLYDRMIVRMGHMAALYASAAAAPGAASDLPAMFEVPPAPSRKAPGYGVGLIAFGGLALLLVSLFERPGLKAQSACGPSCVRRVPLGQVVDLGARFERRHTRCRANGTPAA